MSVFTVGRIIRYLLTKHYIKKKMPFVTETILSMLKIIIVMILDKNKTIISKHLLQLRLNSH